MGGLGEKVEIHQTAMKLFEISQGRMEMFVRISIRSTGWVHGSVWLPIIQAKNLMDDLKSLGYRVETTKKYEDYQI